MNASIVQVREEPVSLMDHNPGLWILSLVDHNPAAAVTGGVGLSAEQESALERHRAHEGTMTVAGRFNVIQPAQSSSKCLRARQHSPCVMKGRAHCT